MSDDRTLHEKTFMEQEKTRKEEATRAEKPPQETSLHPKTFRGYTVIREFPAHGGEADTYLLEKKGQKFFLKLYRKGLSPKEEVFRRLYELSRRYPEHVVYMFEYGYDETTGRYYEILEYTEFGNLSQFARERKLTGNETFVKEVVKELAESLHTLHEVGIIHRDVKLSNVLVRKDNPLDLILTDFGISTLKEEEVSKVFSTVKGTYAYTAPESFSGYFGKEVDWWALGMIVLELLTGSNPFSGLAPQVIMHRLMTQEVPVPEVKDDYRLLLMGLLTRDPKKRWGYKQIRLWLEGDRNIEVYYSVRSKTELGGWLKAGFTEEGAKRWMEVIDDPEKAKAWRDGGFTPDEVKPWVEAGLDNYFTVASWMNVGFNKPEEVKFFEDRDISPVLARKFIESSLSLEDIVYLLEKVKLSVTELKKLVEDVGLKGPDILRWYSLPFRIDIDEIKRLKRKGVDPITLKSFLDAGFKFEEAVEWIEKGFELKDAVAYKSAGISAEDMNKIRYLRLRGVYIDPETIKRFRDAGFAFEEAFEWIEKGFKLKDAIACKSAGISAGDAAIWRGQGFKVEEAIKWGKRGFDPMEAVVWKKQGLEPIAAGIWKRLRFSPETSRKMMRILNVVLFGLLAVFFAPLPILIAILILYFLHHFLHHTRLGFTWTTIMTIGVIIAPAFVYERLLVKLLKLKRLENRSLLYRYFSAFLFYFSMLMPWVALIKDDFVLKDFDVNTSTQPWQVTKVKGVVSSISGNSFTLNNYTTPILVSDNTVCEYQKHQPMFGNACINRLQIGWYVKVEVSNGKAIEIERERSFFFLPFF